MKDIPGPTLTYGEYDPPISWGKYIANLLIIGSMAAFASVAYLASNNHFNAALYAGKNGIEKKVVLEQREGEQTTITHENRKWLHNIATESGGK
tara:strand:- start:556 stop:837 length:282 start_codon:yes stop_codon:yes gene_type:complete